MSSAASEGRGRNTEILSTTTFSLQRLGLLREEIWGSDATDDGNFTWRARDHFSEILGGESNTAACPGTAPRAEPMNTVDVDAETNSLAVSLSHVADTTQQLLRKVGTATHGLDAEAVRQAFHAAACAIVEGREEESGPSTSLNAYYHPPLKMAVDAIRMARIQNCDEARGKTVPAFLKKNNSIPWFHLPSVSAKGGKPSGESKQEEKKPKKRAAASDGAPSAKKKAKVADKQKKVASKVTASKIADAKKKKATAKTPVKRNEPHSRLIFVKAISGIVGDGTVSEDTGDLSEDALEAADRLKTRVLESANNSSRRFDQRREFQMDCHLGQKSTEFLRSTSATPPLLSLAPLQNPFLCETVRNSDAIVRPTNVGGACKVDAEWTKSCLPRLLATLKRGRHAILHDAKWTDREFRVADLLHNLISLPTSSLSLRGHCNFGPHLIVTSRGADFDSFSDAFESSGIGLRLFKYRGSGKERAHLRKQLAQGIPGLPSSPFHVVLVAYSDLIADRVHFRKMSFQAAILDDGMSLLGCANADPDSNIHKIWERMWNDIEPNSMIGGLGEVSNRSNGWLTARYRILLASSMTAVFKGQAYKASAKGLLCFLCPEASDVMKEIWEANRAFSCRDTINSIRGQIATSMAVYTGDGNVRDPRGLTSLALQSMNGEFPANNIFANNVVSVDGDSFEEVNGSKSRPYAISWFRLDASIRHELGALNQAPKATISQKVLPASCLTVSGAGGLVSGQYAYRPAVNRSFNSEQWRQHTAAAQRARATCERRTKSPLHDCVQNEEGASIKTLGQGSGDMNMQAGVVLDADKLVANSSHTPPKEAVVPVVKEPEVDVDGRDVTADEAAAALAVIDVKAIPPHIKPLLRDPNQTSKSSSNKRYVYAYRGVCRQSRKGTDRWQSQISYVGTNHYLGTFESEWNAAAVYAWAHLILYGEEATRKAQKEGEDAVAAFDKAGFDPKVAPKVRRASSKGAMTTSKLPPPEINPKCVDSKELSRLVSDTAFMLSSGNKGSSKLALVLSRRDVAEEDENGLRRIISSAPDTKLRSYSPSTAACASGRGERIAAPMSLGQSVQRFINSGNTAVLVGINPSDFNWKISDFIQSQNLPHPDAYTRLLNEEFGPKGKNRCWCAAMISPSITIGRRSEKIRSCTVPACELPFTFAVESCNIGGNSFCGESAAAVQFNPTKFSNFQITAKSDHVVTINGKRLVPKSGPIPLKHMDVCSVGSRVFAFIEVKSLQI